MATVYLADPDVAYRKSMAEALRRSGITVTEFANGSDLYARTITSEPDLVVMETDLEGIDGFQVFSRLQDKQPRSSFPIVFLTSFDHQHVAQVCKRRGALDYIGKKDSIEPARERIRNILTECDPLRDRTLPAALAWLRSRGKSGRIDVESNSEKGYILLHEGEAIGACWQFLEGEDAVAFFANGRRRWQYSFREGQDEIEIPQVEDLRPASRDALETPYGPSGRKDERGAKPPKTLVEGRTSRTDARPASRLGRARTASQRLSQSIRFPLRAAVRRARAGSGAFLSRVRPGLARRARRIASERRRELQIASAGALLLMVVIAFATFSRDVPEGVGSFLKSFGTSQARLAAPPSRDALVVSGPGEAVGVPSVPRDELGGESAEFSSASRVKTLLKSWWDEVNTQATTRPPQPTVVSRRPASAADSRPARRTDPRSAAGGKETRTDAPAVAAGAPAEGQRVLEPVLTPLWQLVTRPLNEQGDERKDAEREQLAARATERGERAAPRASAARPPDAGGPDYSLATIRERPQFVPVDSRPLPRGRISPRYPRALADRKLGGTVTLWVLVGESGQVEDVQVLRPSGQPELDRSAMDAIRSTLYRPARRNQAAVPAWTQSQVVFKLD